MGEQKSVEAPSPISFFRSFLLLSTEWSCLQGVAGPSSLQQSPIVFGAVKIGNHHTLPSIKTYDQDSFVLVSRSCALVSAVLAP